MNKTVPMVPGSRVGQLVKGMKLLGKWGLTVIVIMASALLIADTGMRHAQEVDALRLWFHETRFGWLGWRFCIYCGLVWGCRKIWRAPGFRAEYRLRFARICMVSALFFLLCEYAIFSAAGD
ncbi:hypothetical protein P4P03_004542 [Escherichia coli]|uniref:Uncharacterized protein n=1 Tax=Escherichia coli TaxID=562 RepID=A0AAP8VVE0_ECOLX|nr:hypothetical protein [Escherichia coli]EED1399613.1 hypothetical protein [Escherichia coli]EER9148212.1 hypothetical protein [Escherichia coli]EEU2030517.1 hypothetical protein [Escherichia coli]EEY7386347.1 hypothetical protein [Escherichia coli]EEY8154822.1 hypothetical protein [Escherichia coli]